MRRRYSSKLNVREQYRHRRAPKEMQEGAGLDVQLLDGGGTVLERYACARYGDATYLEPDFEEAAKQASEIGNTHVYTGRGPDPEPCLQLNRHRCCAAHLVERQ